MINVTAEDLLEAREKRVELINNLLKHYKSPLLVMRVNYPGLNKTNDLTLTIVHDMSTLLCSILGRKLTCKSLLFEAEGPIFLAVVKEDALSLKKITVEMEENHVLGRCLDLDVYDSSGRSLSRQELGYPKRKCYLCEDDAHHCVRARRHPECEVINYIEEKFKRYRESVEVPSNTPNGEYGEGYVQ